METPERGGPISFAIVSIPAAALQWFALGWLMAGWTAPEPAPVWPAIATSGTAAALMIGYAAWVRRVGWRDVALLVTTVATVVAAVAALL